MSTTGTTPTPDLDEVFERAVTAACSVLVDASRADVSEALRLAGEVYDEARDAEVDQVMQETGFAGMEIVNDGLRLRLKYAADIASAMVSAFDALIKTRGAENYVEWESTVTDPATEQAIKAGLPSEQWPPYRRYHLIVVKPGGKRPHELRREAEQRADAAVAERDRLAAQLRHHERFAEQMRGAAGTGALLPPRAVRACLAELNAALSGRGED